MYGLRAVFYGKCTIRRLSVGNRIFHFAKIRLYRTIAIDSKAKPRDTSAIYFDTIELITLSGSGFYSKYCAIIYNAARGNLLRAVLYLKRTACRLAI